MPRARANGIGIHYQSVGTAADVIMIHGLTANLTFWHLHLAHYPLNKQFRITTYDLRGHGYSDMPSTGYTSADLAKDLCGLLDHLGIERANIVGHSFGGAVALHFALLFPERVKTVTLADARVPSLQPLRRLSERQSWNVRRRRIQNYGIEIPDDTPQLIYSAVKEISREQDLEPAFSRPPQFASSDNWELDIRAGRRWRMLLERTSALTDFTNAAGLTAGSIHQITQPTLAIYGEYSYCMPTCNGLTELLPRCTKIIVPAAGHLHPALRPLNFIKHLMRFIKCHDKDYSKATRIYNNSK
jgi:pimeloyl-ACP methyl ester carboxylesterase